MAHAENGCSQTSRFPTAGQGERSSGNEIGTVLIKAHAHGTVRSHSGAQVREH